jgi:hypothetical protein
MTASDMARALGRRGGQARAARLGDAERRRIASLGGTARRLSLEAAQRIASNFSYAAAIRELAGRSRPIVRLRTSDGPLPGLYPGRRPWPARPTTSTKSRPSSRR